jgi:hypothetical protein
MPWLDRRLLCCSIDSSQPYIPPHSRVSKQSCRWFMRPWHELDPSTRISLISASATTPVLSAAATESYRLLVTWARRGWIRTFRLHPSPRHETCRPHRPFDCSFGTIFAGVSLMCARIGKSIPHPMNCDAHLSPENRQCVVSICCRWQKLLLDYPIVCKHKAWPSRIRQDVRIATIDRRLCLNRHQIYLMRLYQ